MMVAVDGRRRAEQFGVVVVGTADRDAPAMSGAKICGGVFAPAGDRGYVVEGRVPVALRVRVRPCRLLA